jgi:multidrug efflux system outer membrane protein
MSRAVLVLSAATVLSACSLAPDYQRPVAPVAGEWPEAETESGREASALDWKAFFPDPRLQYLIAAALEHNRDLRIAIARVEEARSLYGIARADRLPNVDFAAGRSASRTPADLSMTGQRLTAQRFDVDLAVSSFELDFWGRVRNLADAARASYLASDEAQRVFRLSLVADVANAYFTLTELQERTALARATVTGRSELRELIARRREVGLVGDLDYLAADGALQTALAELASLDRQRAAAGNALVLLVGQSPPTLPEGRKLSEQGIVVDLAVGLPSDVLVRRPDVLAAEQRLIAANANIGAARAAFLPRIGLTGTFGTASAALSGLFNAGSDAWSFQPVLRLPLFDFGRAAANVDLAEARKVIAVADYEKTIQQAFREVADLLVARERLAEQLTALQAGEKTLSDRQEITEARYRAGIANYLEVLDAQRDLFAAQQGVVQARRAWLTAAAQLYKALGGG